MPTEIEAKMRIRDFAKLRDALQTAGARHLGKVLETNTFFDAADHSLLKKDSGLRLRINRHEDGRQEYFITFKGPLQSGELKTRDEIELTIDNSDRAINLFARLGYHPELTFEKHRESWRLADCSVELDEMPYLGKFVEIEGPDEPAVMRLRQKLGLENLALEKRGYIALLSDYLRSHRIHEREIRLRQ